MPTGRPAFNRCRRCQNGPGGSQTDWGTRYTRVADHCFELTPTGNEKRVPKYGYRRNVPLYEYRCSRGHVFWSDKAPNRS